MIKFFKNKDKSKDNRKKIVNEPEPVKLDTKVIEVRIKELAENFISSNLLDVSVKDRRVRVSALKWLYAGYGEYKTHAIIPSSNNEAIATEIVQDGDFVNGFLQNKRDLEGKFGYFVARVESNYVYLADNGNRIFSAVNEKDIGDYDALVLIKQSKRLFPKINSQTLSVDLKHIEIFGDVFNKLKIKLSVNSKELSPSLKAIMAIDVPTYTNSSIKIESSEDSFYILKLAEVLEKISTDFHSITSEMAIFYISNCLERVEKVKDNLYVSENTSRFLHAIENLEKVTDTLHEIVHCYKILDGSSTSLSEKDSGF